MCFDISGPLNYLEKQYKNFKCTKMQYIVICSTILFVVLMCFPDYVKCEAIVLRV